MSVNARFKPIMLNSAQINDYPIKEGQFIVSMDAYGIFLDIDSSTRKHIEQIISITESEKEELLAPISGFYYTTDSKKFYYYNGEWNAIGGDEVNITESEKNGYISVNGINIKVFDASNYAPLTHTTDYLNPHKVSKSQVGLGKVENYSVSEILEKVDYDLIIGALGYTPPMQDTTYKAATSTTLGLIKSGKHLSVGSDGLVTVVGGYATQLAKAVNINLTGAVTGSASFDGSKEVSIATSLADVPASKIKGVLSLDNLPQGALERLVKVENQTARLKLTKEQVQLGDTVQELDTGLMYIVVDENNLDSSDGYIVYTAGSAASVPWAGVTGKPGSFTPSAHTHTLSQITDYKAYVHPAYTQRSSGLYKITVDNTGHVSAVTAVTKSDITALGIPGQDTNTTYTTATSDTLGLIKIGYSASGKNYPLLLDSNGKAYVTVPWTDNNTTYTQASSSALGLIKIGYATSGKNYAVVLDSEGKAYVNVPWTDNNTVYSKATSTTLGLLKIGYVASGKNYPVTLDSDGNAYVSVPWTDTNTTYSAFKGASSSAGGSVGLVPAPSSGQTSLFLKSDGTWGTPTNTTYGLATSSSNGLLSSGDFTKLSKFTATEASFLSGVTSAIQTQLNGKAPSSHTHTKSQITDFPTSMPASDVSAWAKASTKPTYTPTEVGVIGTAPTSGQVAVFDGTTGKIKSTGFTIAASVPSGAKFTDTVYTHPTSSGNKHIPSGGSSGQILRWSADGTAVWGADNNTTYSTGTATTAGITKLYTSTGTATDGTMTQAAINTALSGKAPTSHTHTKSQITDFPAALKNPTALTIQFNGSTNQTYDGSAAKTVNITPAAIGASASNHSHAWSAITSKPDIMNCLRMYGGTALDSKATTTDDKAQYKAIAISTATASTSAFSKVLTDLPKGKYSVMIRMKISAISSSGNIIKVQCGDTSALKTFYVKPNMFTSANTYQTFGFTVDLTTTSFTANLSIGSALSGQTLTIDYIAIAPTFTAITSVA